MGEINVGDYVVVDERGRVLIPASQRKRRGIKPKDRFRIEGQGKTIILEYLVEEPKTVRRGSRWTTDAFLCAGEATFGE